MRMDSPSFVSFREEMTKIAFSQEQKESIKRHLLNAGVGAAGFGLGYGVGSASGRLLAYGKPGLVKHRYTPLVLGALSAGGGLLAKHLAEKRKEYLEQR